MNTFNLSDNLKMNFFKDIGFNVINLQSAMELNAFDKARRISLQIRKIAETLGIDDLGKACDWMEEVCVRQRTDLLLHPFQVIEVIAARYVNIPKLRLA